MRAYGLLDFQAMIVAFFLGLVAVILTYVAWGKYALRNEGRIPKEEPEPTEIPGYERSPEGKAMPVAPFLIVLYVGTVVWIVAYIVIVGIFGGPID